MSPLGLSILAGIAASDAICCVRFGRYRRGEGHSAAPLSSYRLRPRMVETLRSAWNASSS